jgi:hypothetical protein
MTARKILLKYRQHIVDMGNPDNMVGQLTLDEALKKLKELVEGNVPCASKDLKLSAREKFIWLSGVRECRDKIAKLFEGE